MISIQLAQQLKAAGLEWKPQLHDFFAVPDRGFDDRVFVISDVQTNIENLFGTPAVAFQGASEWALDYLVMTEAVWVPTEDQLRRLLEENLYGQKQTGFSLSWTMTGYRLTFFDQEEEQHVNAQTAEEAYAKALLALIG